MPHSAGERHCLKQRRVPAQVHTSLRVSFKLCTLYIAFSQYIRCASHSQLAIYGMYAAVWHSCSGLCRYTISHLSHTDTLCKGLDLTLTLTVTKTSSNPNPIPNPDPDPNPKPNPNPNPNPNPKAVYCLSQLASPKSKRRSVE